MVDVDSILLSVQERDKWRKRAAVLENALRDVREHRRRLESRMRRVKKELNRLTLTLDAALDHARSAVPMDVTYHAASAPPYR